MVLARRRVFHRRKGRPTVEGGRIVYIPPREHVYLGRDVKDVGKKGLDRLSEVREILRELEKDAKIISPRIIQARTHILWLAVKRDSDFTEEQRRKAIKMINDFRKKHGWKPL